jgi:hypothetical protein
LYAFVILSSKSVRSFAQDSLIIVILLNDFCFFGSDSTTFWAVIVVLASERAAGLCSDSSGSNSFTARFVLEVLSTNVLVVLSISMKEVGY